MLRSYSDITSRLGEPLWWDEHGAPRYEPFNPRMLGVYDDIAVLYRIKCQACLKPMLVASSSNPMSRMKWHWMFAKDGDEYPKPDLAKFCVGIHYGDPPRHGCPGAGETMNCYDTEIIEAWERYEGGQFKEWTRHPELEVELEDAAEVGK